MSSEEFELATKVSGEAPWWVKAPMWLSLGIVGVPSLIAIGAGFFIVKSVAGKMESNSQFAVQALSTIDSIKQLIQEYHRDDKQQWSLMRDYMGEQLRIELRACLHACKDQRERDECLQVSKRDIERLQKALPSYRPDPPEELKPPPSDLDP
jgi:hypothetical protein